MKNFKIIAFVILIVSVISIGLVSCGGSKSTTKNTTWRDISVDYPVFTQTTWFGFVDEQSKVTIDFGATLAQDVVVTLGGLDTSIFSYPSSITAKKGTSSVSIYVTANAISNGTLTISGKYYQVTFNRSTDFIAGKNSKGQDLGPNTKWCDCSWGRIEVDKCTPCTTACDTLGPKN